MSLFDIKFNDNKNEQSIENHAQLNFITKIYYLKI
jgi:hypothetical protein